MADLGWNYGKRTSETNRNADECNFCKKVTNGKIFCHKQHLVGTYKDVSWCEKCPHGLATVFGESSSFRGNPVVTNRNADECNFCKKVTNGRIFCHKQHLVGTYKDVSWCEKCPHGLATVFGESSSFRGNPVVTNRNADECNFCKKVTNGRIFCHKQHLVGTHKDVSWCEKCPHGVRK
ncbi:hypothetical protein H5410_035467 [Solanum commersonii]|uniref:Uncharacterized protein n=1 Tax=Solanum commersonii TaxID=4109 RepID=A0A9J5Y0R7_SOLCO|nr:hypothetical protein H5410_035467 [Solanum commersonii]